LTSRVLVGLTGPPGCGKTTTVEEVARILRGRGANVGGFVTREVRVSGRRIGFDLVDLGGSGSMPLARKESRPAPRVGGYRVYVENMERFAVPIICRALQLGSILIVDEVGPMELLSSGFRTCVRKALSEAKKAVFTIHYQSRDPLIETVRSSVDRLLILSRGEGGVAAEEVANLLLRVP